MSEEQGPSTRPSWEERYASGGPLPWDTGRPDPQLVATVEGRDIAPGRTVEIGCGTGSNCLWLAERGHQVLGVDLSSSAIEAARSKAAGHHASERCRFEVVDFLRDNMTEAPFELAFDRGCFHVFDKADERARFAERVAALLGEGALWLSIIGSTEGPPRDHGPPRRSLRDIAAAIEPHLEIIELRAMQFDAEIPTPARGWVCLSRKRAVSAQPSTLRE